MKQYINEKRLMSLAIAFIMCATVFSITSVADEPTIEPNLVKMSQRAAPNIDSRGYILQYHDGSPWYYFKIPNTATHENFNERFTMPFAGTLDTAYVMMYSAGSVDVTGEGIDVIVWSDDGTGLPSTELGRVTVPTASITFDTWTAVDLSSLALTFTANQDFHIGYTTVNQAAGNIMAILSDDGLPTPNNIRSSCYLSTGTWNYIKNLYTGSIDVDFFIAAEVTSTGTQWPDCKMHYPQEPDPIGWDVFAMYPSNPVADDFMCMETGYITDLHFWGSWYLDIMPPGGMPPGFHISIYADIPDPDGASGPLYSEPGVKLWEQDVFSFITTPMPPSPQGWFEPPDYFEPQGNHQQYFQYDIFFTAPYFLQHEGTIYWIEIMPYPDPSGFWGWKTSQNHFNDDAVYLGEEPYQIPILEENFDAYTPEVQLFPPTGWSVQGISSPSWFQVPTSYWARCNRIINQASDEWLISETYDFTSNPTVWLTYYVYFYNSTSDTGGTWLKVKGSIDGGATWPYTIVQNATSVSGYTRSYDISSWAAGQSNVKIAWEFICPAISTTVYDYVYIDTVTLGVPAIVPFPPTGWTVYNVDGGDQWILYSTYPHSGAKCSRCMYDTANNDWLVSKPIVMPSSPVDFSLWLARYSLSYSDLCEVWYSTTGNTVADFTGTGTLLWSGDPATAAPTYTQYSFTIPVSAGTTVWFALRYVGTNDWYAYTDDWTFPDGSTEGFEGTPAVIYYQQNFANIIPASGWPPAGWTMQVVSGTDTDNKWKINDTVTYPTGVIPRSLPYMAEYDVYIISGGNRARLYTPAMDFSTGTGHQISFMMYQDDDSATSLDHVNVTVSTDGSTWTNITQFFTYDPTEGWKNKVVDLSAYDGLSSVWVGFLGVSYYGYNNVYIDDVSISYFGGYVPAWMELIDPMELYSLDMAFVVTGIPDYPPVACYTWIDADGSGTGTLINFDASCSSDDYGIVLYEWDWDNDGTYDATGVTQSYDFGDALSHDVTLQVTDTISQTATITNTVQASIPVDNPPVACFNWVDADGIGLGTLINFDASCSSDDYGIVLYEWDWDNDAVYDATGVTQSYDFGDTLPHTVTLQVTDTIGQTATISITVQASAGVDNPPVACYTWADADGTGVGTLINFDATCSSDDYGIVLYEWDWDNDAVYDATGITQSYDFGDTDPHIVTLQVTDTIGQTSVFTDTVQAEALVEILDVEQSTFDRGFPIRHTSDGDWGGAQNFTPTIDSLTKAEIYIKKMGVPEFDLTVELRLDGPQATLLDTVVIPAATIPTDWTWVTVDFADTTVGTGSDVFIVCPPAPPGGTTSYGYEWGYALGNQYDGGAFWFTRNGGGLWRDLPTMYEFVFKTYGYGVYVDLPPTACYNWVDADGSGAGTAINFDASCSTDYEGIVLYEWDWDNDATYDATGVTQSYDFGDTASHTVTVRVTDTIAQTDTVTQAVQASAGSVVVLSEDFEGGVIPSGWTVTSYDAETWEVNTDFVGSGSYSARVWWSYYEQDEWLISPTLDLSSGSGSLDIYTQFMGSNYADFDWIEHDTVEISTDGGTSWTEVTDFPYDYPDNGWGAWGAFTVDLSSYVDPGDNNVKIAFHRVTPDGGSAAWGIDDLEVSS